MKREKLRILYVLDFFYPHVGGVPTVFRNLCTEMRRLGHDVTVVTSKEKESKKYEMWNGIKIHRFGSTREQFLFESTHFLATNKERFDIVHTCTYSAMAPTFLFSKLKGTPKVVSVFEIWSLSEWMEFTRAKGPFYFLEERALFSLPFDLYIIATEHTREDLKKIGIPQSKTAKILCGIDDRIFSPRTRRERNLVREGCGIGKDEVVGCFVGKATVFKGIDYMLDGLEEALKKSKKKFRFVFLLSRSHESGYRKFLTRVHASDTLRQGIILVEPKTEHTFASKIMAACDFLVMPSLTEGFGLAVAESLSVGTPVVVTRGTCLEEIVEEDKNAILIKQRSGRDIEKAILSLVNDPSLRRRLSKPKKFKSWDKIAEQHVKVYEDVIKRHKEAHG
jgi:glycosyltransferase involved in cell wall biosynthesis